MFGQTNYISKDSLFRFKLSGNLEKVDEEGFHTIDTLEIIHTTSNRIIQTIKPDTKFENPNNYEAWKIIDINYDGNEDFILISGNGQYRDILYDFYIYDIKTGLFSKWESEFNDGANLINVRPSFDVVNKTITTYWHNTDTFQKTSIFKFFNGEYQLVEEYNQELDKETNGKFLITTHKKMVEGKWKLMEFEMISLQKEN
ncbi:hypothetical protein SanaruYs_07270 [Chryseotalea sanaruensis]|uniref:Uncharacterized protein n=1 Tax=Chryseotalea sanaruensis TaxID=2482724 RepID=A0A401U6N6_9BACT|nr:hypothetical protein SanaruYs_07270 [Chryseotalea sanaruensis]